MKNKKKCFVIMPFSETDSLAEEKWTEIFEYKIKPAVEESALGYECKRYSLGRANVLKDILEELNRANVVIADLTDNNANVLWELGVRHTLSKRTILIAQDKKFLPSDLKDYPIITYKYKQPPAQFARFKQEIREKLEDIEANPDKADSPIADFLEVKNIAILSAEKSANLKKMSSLISEISYNIDAVNSILTQVEENKKARQKDKMGVFYLHLRFSNTCLELLLSTSYIIPSQKLLENIRYSNEFIKALNANLAVWPNREEEVEEKLLKNLPRVKRDLTELLTEIAVLRIDYKNDNYQEPKEPIILLSSPEHEEYLKITKAM